MTKIKIDDLVKFRGIVGVVTSINKENLCTVKEVTSKNVHQIALANLELVARKGTRRHSLEVEGALPITKAPSAKVEAKGSPMDVLQGAYINSKVSRIDSSDQIDFDNLTEDDLLSLIDIALTFKDKELFDKCTALLKKLKKVS